jgi:nucleotide-binding universal stress UspA family protein
MGTIVVGMDDSPGGRAAVAWAADYARDRGDDVVVVDAFAGGWALSALQVNVDNIQKEEDRILPDIVCAPLRDAGVQFRTVKQTKETASALLAVAKDADAYMIVYGQTIHHGFTEHVLGATLHKLLTHTERPVVVVPARPEST